MWGGGLRRESLSSDHSSITAVAALLDTIDAHSDLQRAAIICDLQPRTAAEACWPSGPNHVAFAVPWWPIGRDQSAFAVTRWPGGRDPSASLAGTGRHTSRYHSEF